MLSDGCLSVLPVCPVCPVLSVLSVCNVGALWPNGWTDQDETWRAGRPRPWPHCVRSEPSSPSPKGAQPPIFGPYQLQPDGCVDQDVTWYGARTRPRKLCVRWGPRSPPQKEGGAPQFSAHFYCGQIAGCIKMPLGMEVGLGPVHIVLDGDTAPFPKTGKRAPKFSANIVAKRLDASRCHLIRR